MACESHLRGGVRACPYAQSVLAGPGVCPTRHDGRDGRRPVRLPVLEAWVGGRHHRPFLRRSHTVGARTCVTPCLNLKVLACQAPPKSQRFAPLESITYLGQMPALGYNGSSNSEYSDRRVAHEVHRVLSQILSVGVTDP